MKSMILFLSLFAVLLMCGSGFSADLSEPPLRGKELLRKLKEDEMRMKRDIREGRSPFRLESLYRSQLDYLNKVVPDVVRKCLDNGNDTLMALVQYGRYISAFEFCRKQGGGVDECIERVKKAKEEWRSRCQEPYLSLRLFYYKEIVRAEDVQIRLKGLTRGLDVCYGGGLCELATAQLYADMSQRISQWFPGSQFNLRTGTGSIVLGDGVIYYQDWQFIQREFKGPGGLVVQIFPQKINMVNGAYYITIAVESPEVVRAGKTWEVVDFNLPFDAKTERQFIALNKGVDFKGVDLTNREIIQMVDGYLKNTAWEADLLGTFQKLLLGGRERTLFMESLIEYYAFDNYIKMVKTRQMKEQEKESINNQKQNVKKTGKRSRR
jgi:hypothetical protein